MQWDNKTVFVSGANRGIGKSIIEALLKEKVKKIYAGARQTADFPEFSDTRIVPLTLDITDAGQIKAAAAKAQDVDVLINNAGALSGAGVVKTTLDILMHDMQVNYFGTMSMVHHFAPLMEKKGGGAIANVISVVGLSSMASIGSYSASKAALFSATQSMRAELKTKKIEVFGIFPGPIDTDMSREFKMAKTSPQVTAENILKGMAEGREDIFPDPMSQQARELWAKDPKGLERQFAAY